MKRARPAIRRRKSGGKGLIVGVRTDPGDGHTRVSRGGDFVALGGSREAHEHLRETVAEISDEVKRRGRELADLPREEFGEIVARALEKTGRAPS
jgi:hypothetical protein